MTTFKESCFKGSDFKESDCFVFEDQIRRIVARDAENVKTVDGKEYAAETIFYKQIRSNWYPYINDLISVYSKYTGFAKVIIES